MTPHEAVTNAILKMEGVNTAQHPSGTLLLQAGDARLRVTPRADGTWLVTPPGKEYSRADKLVHYVLVWSYKHG